MKIQEMFEKSQRDSLDMHAHMDTLFNYASSCEHITEMGVGGVNSTWAFAKAKPKKLICYDINRNPNVDLVETLCKEEGIEYHFILEDTTKANIEETDFLFIDTSHTYECLAKELSLHGNKVKKYIGFHDTELFGHMDEGRSSYMENGEIYFVNRSGDKHGLMQAIDEFLVGNTDWVMDYQTPECYGLTVIKKLSFE